MPDTDILRALLERLNAYTTSLPVAYLGKNWDGSAFEPPSSGMWLESSYFPNEPDDIMWAEPEAMQMGFFQVSVCFRNDTFETLARAEAADVVAHFDKGRQLTGEIRINQRPYTSPRVTGDVMSHIPITIPYRGMG